MKMRKLLLCAILVVTAMLITTNIYATSLPWLDFGSNLIWDSNTNTLTADASTYVFQVHYKDGTTVPPPFPPSDGVIFSPVTLLLSFNSGIGSVSIGSWLTADLTYSGPVVNPLGATPNPVIVKMSNINVNTGAGSRWADEFDSVLDDYSSLLYPARLNIAWLGSIFNIDLGNGKYKVNAGGEIAPVPEPGTLLLLGSGLMGVAFYRRRKNK